MASKESDLVDQALGRGARTGYIAACNGTRQNQIQGLLEVLGSYPYPESLRVLLLYVSYQAGRQTIDKATAKQLIEDLLFLNREAQGAKLGGEEIQEILRKYLGSLKWVYTAINQGRLRVNCRETPQPSVEEVVKRIADAIQGSHRRGYGHRGYR